MITKYEKKGILFNAGILLILANVVLGLCGRVIYAFSNVLITGIFTWSNSSLILKVGGLSILVVYFLIVILLNYYLITNYRKFGFLSIPLFFISLFVGINEKVYNKLLSFADILFS